MGPKWNMAPSLLVIAFLFFFKSLSPKPTCYVHGRHEILSSFHSREDHKKLSKSLSKAGGQAKSWNRPSYIPIPQQ